MAFIGKVVTGKVNRDGYELVTKGIRASVTQDILGSVAALKPGESLELEQSVIEAAAGKTLPKHFKANIRKALVDRFGKGTTEMVEYKSTTGGKSLFVFTKIQAPAPANPSPTK